jgi:RNA polymerase sigma factor (sigma-70 family)
VHLTNQQIEIVLEGCRQNSRPAQKELYTAYFGFVMSLTIRYARNYEEAVEMANDGLLKVYRDISRFTPRYDSILSSFGGWLKKVVINSSIDYLRKYNKLEHTQELGVSATDLADRGVTGADELQYKEILKCIDLLAWNKKLVFNLYVIDGLTHVEISKKLGIPVNTSKGYLFKAKQELQAMLKKNEIIYEQAI